MCIALETGQNASQLGRKGGGAGAALFLDVANSASGREGSEDCNYLALDCSFSLGGERFVSPSPIANKGLEQEGNFSHFATPDQGTTAKKCLLRVFNCS